MEFKKHTTIILMLILAIFFPIIVLSFLNRFSLGSYVFLRVDNRSMEPFLPLHSVQIVKRIEQGKMDQIESGSFIWHTYEPRESTTGLVKDMNFFSLVNRVDQDIIYVEKTGNIPAFPAAPIEPELVLGKIVFCLVGCSGEGKAPPALFK